MDLDTLVATVLIESRKFENKMSREREKFENKIRLAARNLNLKEIIGHIEFNPKNMDYSEFKEGSTFEFSLFPSRFSVFVLPEEIYLKTGSTEIARYKGKNISDYYKSLLEAIQKAGDEGAFNLPF